VLFFTADAGTSAAATTLPSPKTRETTTTSPSLLQLILELLQRKPAELKGVLVCCDLCLLQGHELIDESLHERCISCNSDQVVAVGLLYRHVLASAQPLTARDCIRSFVALRNL